MIFVCYTIFKININKLLYERGKVMKSYYVMFYHKNKKICGCWKRANSGEEATMMAEFALMGRYPNVEYDRTEIINEKE